jgi:hypothetical protein
MMKQAISSSRES